MLARLSAFVIWAIVGAAAMFWILRLTAGSEPPPPYAVAVDRAVPLRGDLARLLGAPPLAVVAATAPVEAPSRFKLIGVMAPKGAAEGAGRYGLALIATDGKPPKAYPVGARIEGDVIVQAVSLRTASVGPAGAQGTLLELPALPPPATGSLPPPGSTSPAPARPPMPVPQPSAPIPQPAPAMQAPMPAMQGGVAQPAPAPAPSEPPRTP